MESTFASLQPQDGVSNKTAIDGGHFRIVRVSSSLSCIRKKREFVVSFFGVIVDVSAKLEDLILTCLLADNGKRRESQMHEM